MTFPPLAPSEKLDTAKQQVVDDFFNPKRHCPSTAASSAAGTTGAQVHPNVPTSWGGTVSGSEGSGEPLPQVAPEVADGEEKGLDVLGDLAAIFPAGQPNPPTPERPAAAPLTAEKIMQEIQGNRSAALMQTAAGVPLTEENLLTYQALLAKLGTDLKDTTPAATPGMSDGDRKKADAMKLIAEGGAWDARSYLANTFRGEHNAKTVEGQKYKACKNRAEAAEFRKDWCDRQYKHLVERKTFTQAWKRVDRTKGVYRPFGRLVQDFGGWSSQEAVDGAVQAMAKCSMMGAPWVQVHPQSGMTEYLVLEMGFEEEFESMWSKFSESWQGDKAIVNGGAEGPAALGSESAIVDGGAGGSGGRAAAEAADTGKPKKGKGASPGVAGGATPKIKKNAGKGTDNDETKDSPGADKKTEILKLTREALKLKQVFHAASSNYVQVMTAISSDEKWSWARGGPQETRLRDTKAKLQAELNDWHEEFLVTAEFTQLKRKYSTERIVVELSKFVQTKGLVDGLAKVISSTHNAHHELTKT
jgi:hypothetical protein